MPSKPWSVVVCSDFHCPFTDASALKELYRTVDEIDPRTIVVAGDLCDFYKLSTFTKNPLSNATLQTELHMAGQILDRLGRERVVFLTGNHEERLYKYLWSHADAFAGLDCLRLHSLLGLKERQVLPYGQPYKVTDEFIAVHGSIVRRNSGASAHAEMSRYGCSGISGHTHRLAQVWSSGYSGQRTWIENGCLCDLSPEYMKHPDWQQGFTVLTVDRGRVLPQLIKL